MKKILTYIVVALFLVFAVSCNKSDDGPSEPTDGTSAEQYYPGGVGSSYNYQGQMTDSTGTTSTYNRNVSYTSQQSVNNNTYINQSNVLTMGQETTTGDFLFRTTTNAMYIYIDLSSLEDLLDSVDTGGITIDISADSEVKMLSYPFSNNTDWDAFNVDISAYNGLVTLNVLKLKGYYRGQESVTIMNQNMTAEKVEYIGTIKIPESIEDIANPQTVTVSASAWFVKDVGLVKLDGSGLLAGAFSGSGIDLSGDNSTITETLVGYNIQ